MGEAISTGSAPDCPAGFTRLGSYKFVVDEASYYATLSSRDADSKLRILNVVLRWSDHHMNIDDIAQANAEFSLSIHVLLD